MDTVSWLGLRTAARLGIARRVRLRVEGLDHVPATGPVLIASRHYHHLYDALALLTVIPRPLHFFVALDWVHGRWGRRVMEGACRAARWPVVLRQEELLRQAQEHPGRAAYRPDETSRYLRQGMAEATALLRAGRAMAIFPEAYPNVDPRYTPKHGDAFLPFRPGFARLAMMAARDGQTRVPVVPAGLAYADLAGADAGRTDAGSTADSLWLRGRAQVTLRFGAPMEIGVGRVGDGGQPTAADIVEAVEHKVRALSRWAPQVVGAQREPVARADEAGRAAVTLR